MSLSHSLVVYMKVPQTNHGFGRENESQVSGGKKKGEKNPL